jgi:hypothetical protein
MRKNYNPLFALLPTDVLVKAKLLADEFRVEEELKDLAGRRILRLALVIIILALLNGTNAYTFGSIAAGFIGKGNPTGLLATWGYALVIWLGGMLLMFLGLMAWLELSVRRRIDPLSDPRVKGAAFYRRSTWLPLIPISLIPAIFNAWFSLQFFMVAVACMLVFVMLFSIFSDV